MSIQIYRYRQKYQLGTYIGIDIGWTHIGLSLSVGVGAKQRVKCAQTQERGPPHADMRYYADAVDAVCVKKYRLCVKCVLDFTCKVKTST